MQPWFTVYFFDIGHPNKVSADQYYVTISWAQVFFKLTADQVLFSTGSRAHVRLRLKTGQDCSKSC